MEYIVFILISLILNWLEFWAMKNRIKELSLVQLNPNFWVCDITLSDNTKNADYTVEYFHAEDGYPASYELFSQSGTFKKSLRNRDNKTVFLALQSEFA